MLSKLFIFASIIAISFAINAVPVPATPDGYSRGSTTPTLHIVAYFDLICPFSKGQWDVLEPLLNETYHLNSNATLRFTIRFFPLPYHLNSATFTQGLKAIAANQQNVSDVYSYIGLIFENQNNFTSIASMNLSQAQIQASLTELVVAKFPNASSYFADALAYNNAYDLQVRESWKIGAENSVTGTPTFFANGVMLNGGGEFTKRDWEAFINGAWVNYQGGALTKSRYIEL